MRKENRHGYRKKIKIISQIPFFISFFAFGKLFHIEYEKHYPQLILTSGLLPNKLLISQWAENL
ncbi:hypothetical protein M109_0579 [Bacteroides fragilis str. 3397 N2]|uniref:Uncharacterized protein n=1 Tax=Bacteroides fragilis str. 3783N1-6 TaxID=1339310 RepID=A0AB73APT8_BACFG|nr:hypothetical protein M073_0538 [Bacteroides fragilis str. DS-71]EXZ50640.1 hypothetical protein M109_0579 [Bacteroides fragilis str. 3397 N2]EXZ55402.1 hypothetical protein M108_0569 [Bacteroides fragilis str. 3397 T14]EXZ80107.1 hypothetical protein M144_0603 [Bacteroides fragilis str. 3-F-2 \